VSRADLIRDAVIAFVEDVTSALDATVVGLGLAPVDHRPIAINEAFQITCGFIDADRRHTDAELEALIATFGPLLAEVNDGTSHLAAATPATLRNTSLITAGSTFVSTPAPLFGLLTNHDRSDGTVLASIYYQRALDIAHGVIAIDEVAAQDELLSISRYRSMLLAELASNGSRAATPRPSGDPAGAPANGETPVSTLPPEAAVRPIEELLAELDALVGLAAVKTEVRLLADLLRIQQLRREHDLPVVETSLHLVFVGNPGTGKTSVARLLAQILHSLDVLANGQLVETDRSGMVAGFVGQTATLVTKRFDEADGGMLFIDEAYSLARGGANDFGREAIDTMVKLMEDRRDRVVVVVAGYPADMATFIDANPGLASRFTRTLNFPDYSGDELVTIFQRIAEPKRYHLDPAGADDLAHLLHDVKRGIGFGNGRYVRNLFEAAISHQASRLVREQQMTETDLTTLTSADLRAACENLSGSA